MAISYLQYTRTTHSFTHTLILDDGLFLSLHYLYLVIVISYRMCFNNRRVIVHISLHSVFYNMYPFTFSFPPTFFAAISGILRVLICSTLFSLQFACVRVCVFIFNPTLTSLFLIITFFFIHLSTLSHQKCVLLN